MVNPPLLHYDFSLLSSSWSFYLIVEMNAFYYSNACAFSIDFYRNFLLIFSLFDLIAPSSGPGLSFPICDKSSFGRALIFDIPLLFAGVLALGELFGEFFSLSLILSGRSLF